VRSFQSGRQVAGLGVCKITVNNHPYGAHVWEVATGKKSVNLRQAWNNVHIAAVSPDGRLAVTGSSQGTFKSGT